MGLYNRLLAPIKLSHKQNTPLERANQIVSEPIFEVGDQSIMKHHEFENCGFYQVLYDR